MIKANWGHEWLQTAPWHVSLSGSKWHHQLKRATHIFWNRKIWLPNLICANAHSKVQMVYIIHSIVYRIAVHLNKGLSNYILLSKSLHIWSKKGFAQTHKNSPHTANSNIFPQHCIQVPNVQTHLKSPKAPDVIAAFETCGLQSLLQTGLDASEAGNPSTDHGHRLHHAEQEWRVRAPELKCTGVNRPRNKGEEDECV